jgi:carbonic anhydrase
MPPGAATPGRTDSRPEIPQQRGGIVHNARVTIGGTSRRAFLTSGLVAAGGVITAPAAFTAAAAGAVEDGAHRAASGPPASPSDGLAQLQAGNRRFVSGQSKNQAATSVRRAELVEGQSPFATIIGCADSRVPPEIVFDQGLGGLFTIRVAGNTAADALVIGSAEYATSVLKSSLVVVLGHDGCGAVKAAIDVVKNGTSLPGDLPAVVQPIIPAVEAVKGLPADQVLDAAIEENVHLQVAGLRAVPSLAPLVAANKLQIVGAHYRLHSGRVSVQST